MLALTLHPLLAVSIVVAVIFLGLLAWALCRAGAQYDADRERAMRLAQIADMQAHKARKLRGGL